jgi:hypothetical protein
MTPSFCAAKTALMLGLPFYVLGYMPPQCGPLTIQDALWYLSIGAATGHVLLDAIQSIRDEFL